MTMIVDALEYLKRCMKVSLVLLNGKSRYYADKEVRGNFSANTNAKSTLILLQHTFQPLVHC